MEWEDPVELLGRLRLGREEFLQRLLATLIVGGTYPRWNTRSTPTPQGAHFLRRLDELSFGVAAPAGTQVFVDELDLAPRSGAEPGGAPDWAVISQTRLWLIELKTEAASHRPHQIPYYFQLGAHHFPEHSVDVTYVTGPMLKPAPQTGRDRRYAHLTWDAVIPLVSEVWGGDLRREVRRYVDVLEEAVASLSQRWADWRDLFTATTATISGPPHSSDLRALIEAIEADGVQRALDWQAESLEHLQVLRIEARQLVLDSPEGSASRHVMPWIWSGGEQSKGQPLTGAGAECGFELRFWRYTSPVY
jgi:hypothetical protein